MIIIVHGSHSDNCKRLARAFECYVADKFRKGKESEPILTAHSKAVVLVKENGEKNGMGLTGCPDSLLTVERLLVQEFRKSDRKVH